MAKKILVAYATAYGSTRDIAEWIMETLAENNQFQIDVLLVESVKGIDRYDAVILGSAIHGGKWLPEAINFLHTNREALNRIPVAFFLVGLMMNLKSESIQKLIDDFLEAERNMVNPISEGHFLGAFQAKDHPFFEGLGFRFFKAYCGLGWRSGDHRQPEKVRAWASNLQTLLS